MNEKGGIYDKEFMKQFNISLVLLYPDVKDKYVNLVMIKLDNGLGHLNSNIIIYASNLGLIIYPDVPNTTIVTREKDQNHGLFKTCDKYRLP